MGSSYASLPAELVSRITALVHAQDQAWPSLQLKRHEHELIGRDGDSEDEDDPPVKQCSHLYGRGIRALVRVDKRTRSAALPFLLENMTARATTKTYFRFNVLGGPLGQLVRHIDCRHVSADQAVSLACALKGLPILSSIKVNARTLVLLGGYVFEDHFAALAQAVKGVLGRITSLEIEAGTPSDILRALSYVGKGRLRRLCFGEAASLLPLSAELATALASLEALVEVELGNVPASSVDRLQDHLHFPHVRRLSISSRADARTTYETALVFADCVAPRLEVLTLNGVTVSGQQFPRGSPELPLPALRVLRVRECDMIAIQSLHLAVLPALEHLHIAVQAFAPDFPVYLEDVEDLRPASPRIITVEYPSPYPLSPSASVLARCDKLGIDLVGRWRPSTASPHSGLLSPDYEYDEAEERKADAADLGRLFEWAGARARWLLRLGDGPALVELRDAAVRLRERFVIEHS